MCCNRLQAPITSSKMHNDARPGSPCVGTTRSQERLRNEKPVYSEHHQLRKQVVLIV